MRTLLLLTLSVLAFVAQTDRPPTPWREAPPSDWQTIFNGRNLDGWT